MAADTKCIHTKDGETRTLQYLLDFLLALSQGREALVGLCVFTVSSTLVTAPGEVMCGVISPCCPPHLM